MINKPAFKKTAYDSSFIGALTYTIHQLTKEGEHVATVYLNNQIISYFNINFDKEAKSDQVDIDLGTITPQSRVAYEGNSIEVGGEGYVVFYNSKNDNSYKIVIQRMENKKMVKCFDSTKLKKGDLFVAYPIRPGKYHISGSSSKNVTELEVLYPSEEMIRKPGQIEQPIKLKSQESGFGMETAKIVPGQGIIFEFDDPAKVNIKQFEFNEKAVRPRRSAKLSKQKKRKTPPLTAKWTNPRF
ncbi:MAG: hypothetical protein AAFO82_10195 [Bacteroidota bacterium]